MKKPYLILVLIILLHLTFVILSANQLYYGDEVIFLTAAKEIASGQITGSFGYQDGLLIKDQSIMLFHPPTYIYILSLFIKLFGESPYSVRAVSALFSVGSIILVYFITKKILEKRFSEDSEKWALIASFIYAINPATIQNIILIEIDGGLLNFLILLFIYFYISNRNFYYLIPSLFLIFSSKIIGAILVFGALFLTNLITKDFKELLKILKLYIITGVLFAISFYIYTLVFNLNFTYLFLHNSIIGVLSNFLTNPKAILRSIWSFKTFFYFATPFLTFLLILASYKLIKNIFLIKDYLKENKEIFFLWIYILIIFLFNFILGQSAYNFVKYFAIAIAPIIILIIFFTPKKIKNLKKATLLIIITLFILTIYFIIFLKDPLIPEVQNRIINSNIYEVINLVLVRILLYSIIPIFLCIGLFQRIPKKRLWLVLIFLLIFTSFYLNIIQITADYSTHNLYGDKGLKPTIEFLKDKPPEKIAAYIHVIYFLDYKNSLEITTLFHDMDLLEEKIQKNNIQYLVIYEKDLEFIKKEILEEFQLEKQINDYFILKRSVNLE